MNQKKLLTIGKWVLMGILAASNFMFYIVNDTKLNIILAILIVAYSIIEFFLALSGKNLNLGFKLYLFTFYLLAVLSLFLSVRSLLSDNIKSALISLLLIAGDTALILYSIRKLTRPN